MTNFLTIFTTLCILFSFTDAAGIIELHVSSPQTVLLEPTVCANFECPSPDELSHPHKVQGGSVLRFATGHYLGEAREHIDLHLKVLEPNAEKVLAIEHFRPLADNEWSPLIITTSNGFNITVHFKNKCDVNYHGKRCGRNCIPSPERHWECTLEGERKCSAGWDGADCSTPICDNKCSGQGRCVSPGKCSCFSGFNGTNCEQCIPSVGCLHGECRDGKPFTCKCKVGFTGNKCDIDENLCSTQKPCVNGGKCSIDKSSSSGFKCECPFHFLGVRCETPLSSVACTSKEQLCQNGGMCISLDKKSTQCKCPQGFSGMLCQFGDHRDCSKMKCSANSECRIVEEKAMCVMAKETTTTKAPIQQSLVDSSRTNKDDMEDLTNRTLFFLICIVGLVLSIIVIYKRIIEPHFHDRKTLPTLPTTIDSKTSSPVYKICIIDAETNHQSSSDSELEHCPHRCSSPPPAYSSPIQSKTYKSIPMEEDGISFRI